LGKKEKYRMKVRDLDCAFDEAKRDFQRLKSDLKIAIAAVEREIKQLQKKTTNTSDEVKRIHELRRQKKEKTREKDEWSQMYREEADLLREKMVHLQQKHLSVCSQLETVQQQISFYLQSRTQGRTTCVAPNPPCAVIMTDISSSTRIWRRDARTAMEALDVHNTVIRNLIEETAQRNHQIMEVKCEGDSFVISVDSASEACRFALQMQSRLLEARWPSKLSEFPEAKTEFSEDGSVLYRGLRVRCGINYGDMILKVDPNKGIDYFGDVMNLCARLEANAAIGGLIAISESVWDCLKTQERTNPTDKIEYLMHDLGTMSFKGIPAPHHVRILFPNSSLVARLSSKSQFMSKTEKEMKKTKEEAEMWKEKYQQKSSELKLIQNRMEKIETELHSTKSKLYQRLRSKVDKMESSLQVERREKENLLERSSNLQMRLKTMEAENIRLVNQRKKMLAKLGPGTESLALYGTSAAATSSLTAPFNSMAEYSQHTHQFSDPIVNPASPAHSISNSSRKASPHLVAPRKRSRINDSSASKYHRDSSSSSLNTMASLSPLSPSPISFSDNRQSGKSPLRKSLSPPKKRKKEIDAGGRSSMTPVALPSSSFKSLPEASHVAAKGAQNSIFVTQQQHSIGTRHKIIQSSLRRKDRRVLHRVSMDLKSPAY